MNFSRRTFLGSLVAAVALPQQLRAEPPVAKVGILSDTHVSVDPMTVEPLLKAFRRFSAEGVGTIVISGDICEVGTLAELKCVMDAWHAAFPDGRNAQKKVVREYYGSCKPTMTPEQVAAAQRDFGIRTDLDLRGTGQCRGMTGSPLGDDIKFVNVPASNYGGIFEGEGAKLMADELRVFADAANYPVVFHCVKGADRTGSLAFILHALLGVSAEDRLLDWELTAFSNSNPKFAHADRYDKLTAGLAKFPGSTDAERAVAYAKSIGLTDDEIAKIREILLK